MLNWLLNYAHKFCEFRINTNDGLVEPTTRVSAGSALILWERALRDRKRDQEIFIRPPTRHLSRSIVPASQMGAVAILLDSSGSTLTKRSTKHFRKPTKLWSGPRAGSSIHTPVRNGMSKRQSRRGAFLDFLQRRLV